MTSVFNLVELNFLKKSTLNKLRFKNSFAIFPTELKKLIFVNDKWIFEKYGIAWLKKISIIQEQLQNSWYTIAILKPEDAFLFRLEN